LHARGLMALVHREERETKTATSRISGLT
jgi:hypothetical protein